MYYLFISADLLFARIGRGRKIIPNGWFCRGWFDTYGAAKAEAERCMRQPATIEQV